MINIMPFIIFGLIGLNIFFCSFSFFDYDDDLPPPPYSTTLAALVPPTI